MMDRAQFMQELEKLLADISETERQDALDFYNSYFDDAGAENEASVLRELGSPEKVAAIIKADLKGSAGGYEYGEYTEHGYEDARTKERGQMPEKYGEESGTGKRFFRKGNQAVLILAVILLVFISPFVKGAVYHHAQHVYQRLPGGGRSYPPVHILRSCILFADHGRVPYRGGGQEL